jgi:hypothetical protein
MRKNRNWVAALAAACGLALSAPASAALIDFETLTDLEAVTGQFSAQGVSFANTIALQAGFSLNEAEFPPRSGQVVVSDDGGAITLSFARPVLDVGAFFTYAAPLTLTAFDGLGAVLGSVTSAFNENFASAGSGSPNEFLQLAFAGGISRLTIAGDPLGASFVLDDLSFNPVQAVPEPGTGVLLALGLLALGGMARRR